ncbi:MAG: hypothetical protein QOH79_2336 [Acidimicrobiaceae bacterium]|jgi:hypothetical protein
MDAVVLLIGGPILIALGLWTVTHPNGGYRAAGGAGSGVSPGTRRFAGFVFIAMGALLMVSAVTG